MTVQVVGPWEPARVRVTCHPKNVEQVRQDPVGKMAFPPEQKVLENLSQSFTEEGSVGWEARMDRKKPRNKRKMFPGPTSSREPWAGLGVGNRLLQIPYRWVSADRARGPGEEGPEVRAVQPTDLTRGPPECMAVKRGAWTRSEQGGRTSPPPSADTGAAEPHGNPSVMRPHSCPLVPAAVFSSRGAN